MKLPRTAKDLRRRKLEGSTSIYEPLPTLSIKEMKHYAYISPIDILCAILGHGLPLDMIVDETTNFGKIYKISQTQKAKEIHQSSMTRLSEESSVITVWMNERSDDFDLLDSIKTTEILFG